MQIQYVSIAFTCRGSASPRQRSRNFSAAVSPCATTSSGAGSRPSALARRARDDLHHLRRKPAEVLAGLLVGDLVQLAELPLAGQPRGLGLEVGGRVPGQRRGLVRLGIGHLRVEVVVDEQAPDRLVRVVADELLDVDPAIAERAAFAVGLGDLRLDGDDALETRLEVVHGPKCSAPLESAAVAHEVTLIPATAPGRS